MDGYLRAKFAYDKINFRYLIAPSGHIPSSLRPFKMTEKEIDEVIAMGEGDANYVIDNGADATFETMAHYYSLKKQGHPYLDDHSYGSFAKAKMNGEFEGYNIMEDDWLRIYTSLLQKK